MTHAFYLAAAGEHQRLSWIGDSTLTILLDGAASGGQLLVMQAETVRGSSVPVHVHSREDEVFVVVDGDLTVSIGEERRDVSSGGVAYLPRGIPHAYVVRSGRATILEVVTPGGLEAAFREAGWDMRRPVPEGWVCSPAAVAEAMARAGCRILGPPPS